MKNTIITLLVILFALIFYFIGEALTYDLIKNIHNGHTPKKEKIEKNKPLVLKLAKKQKL